MVSNPTPLFGATPAAILATAEKAVTTAELAFKATERIEDDIKLIKRDVANLHERTAREVIRLTTEQVRLAQMAREGSSPEMARAAAIGLGLAQLALDDETTEVRDRQARAIDRARARHLLITWTTRAAVVIGPILTALLMRHCQ